MDIYGSNTALLTDQTLFSDVDVNFDTVVKLSSGTFIEDSI